MAQSTRALTCSRSSRGLTAAAYYNAFAALGLCLAALGPALLSLAEQTNSTLKFTGYCFMIRSIGYAAGSFAGPLYDRMPGHYIMGGSLVFAGLATALIPSATTVYALGGAVVLEGISMGTLDTGGNVMLIFLFGENVGPWMQALHAAFAVGAWLAPLILRAVEGDAPPRDDGLVATHSYDAAFYIIAVYCFLVGLWVLAMVSPRGRATDHHGAKAADASSGEGDTVAIATAGSAPLFSGSADSSIDARESRAEGGGEMRIELPTIGGGGAAGEDLPLPLTAPAPVADAPSLSAAHDPSLLAVDIPRETWRVVGVCALFLALYVGAETGFGGFVTSYAVLQLGLPEATGQLIASAYWASIMAGRFAAIYVSTIVKPGPYLAVSVVGSIAAALVLLLFAPYSEMVLWIGTLAFGTAMACIFPTAIAYAESNFPVVGAHATAFVVGSATGEVILPFLIATLFGAEPEHGGTDASGLPTPHHREPGTVGPVIMLWVVAVGCIGMGGALVLLTRRASRLKSAIEAQKAVAAKSAAAVVVVTGAGPLFTPEGSSNGDTGAPGASV